MNRSHRLLLLAAVAPLSMSILVADPAHAAPADWNGTYEVAPGDNLFWIAKKAGVRLTELLEANELTLTSTIHPGDTLVVPAGTPAAAAAPAAPPAPTTYAVVAGDHLIGIARAHGVTLTALLEANDLQVTSVIFPGRQLSVPPATLPIPAPREQSVTQAPAPSAPASNTTYVVARGDYLTGIAARHGVTLGALVKANSIEVTSLIKPGQQLMVPPATLPIPETVASSPSAPAASEPAVTASPVDTLVTFLRAQVGKGYKFYTAGPETYDCSGLVVAGFAQIDVKLPHQSGMQSTRGTVVDWLNEPLMTGDLIFMARSGTNPDSIGHVGIVLTPTTWIQAPGTNKTVRIGPIPSDNKILAVRRFL